MQINDFINQLSTQPRSIRFSTTMEVIESNYNFTPCAFTNGELINEENTNNGSCKIFGFAQLHNLSKESTLACFGSYYFNDVLENPSGTDHQNIRNFMKYGWEKVSFTRSPLELK